MAFYITGLCMLLCENDAFYKVWEADQLKQEHFYLFNEFSLPCSFTFMAGVMFIWKALTGA